MKPLRCPWNFAGWVLLLPIGIFVALLIGALVLDFAWGVDIPGMAIYGNFAIQGGVWLLVCFIFRFISLQSDWKLARLKNEGTCYEGKAEAFHPVYGVRIMHYLTLRVDCSYINYEQKKCLVRSRAYLYESKGFFPFNIRGRDFNRQHSRAAGHLSGSDFTVFVYVNNHDPRDYAVEVFEGVGEGIQTDYDYR